MSDALTLTDAKQAPIVRRALESALLEGRAVAFGPIHASLNVDGTWTVLNWADRLTTDQAITAILNIAHSL